MRSPATSLQDAKNGYVSREDANSNGGDYSNAENQRHEERNQDRPPYQEFSIRLPQPGAYLNLVDRGIFNLPALTHAASDD
jgi:hypothetical protein